MGEVAFLFPFTFTCHHYPLLPRVDQEFYRRHSMPDMKDENNGKSMSAAARRSFFRRKQKHKRSSSKDGKDILTVDSISTDSLPITDGEPLPFSLAVWSRRHLTRLVYNSNIYNSIGKLNYSSSSYILGMPIFQVP